MVFFEPEVHIFTRVFLTCTFGSAGAKHFIPVAIDTSRLTRERQMGRHLV